MNGYFLEMNSKRCKGNLKPWVEKLFLKVYISTVVGVWIKRGCRPWPTLWPTIWPTGGKYVLTTNDVIHLPIAFTIIDITIFIL